MLSKILKQFDEQFKDTYYGKDENNCPNYIQDNALADIHKFISQSITKTLESVRLEVDKIFTLQMRKIANTPLEKRLDSFNELSNIRMRVNNFIK